MAFRSIVLLGLLASVDGRQPVTATGATEAREKIVPKATPVDSVIHLLKDLTKKVESQGAAEAAAYDKFACFCKEQADNKQYAIERSEKKIADLAAKIRELNADLQLLATEILDLGKEIVGLETDIKHLDSNRTAEHDVYLSSDAEMVAAIDATQRAIEALKDSKAALEGKAQREDALTQVHAAASAASQKGFIVLTAEQKAALQELSRRQNPTASEAYAAKYHSNEVIELLDNLLAQFTKEKNDGDKSEFEAKKLYDNLRLSKTNQKQFKEEDKKEKEAESAAKTAEKEAAQEDKYVETRESNADTDFRGVLEGDCQSKAVLWDQRSRMRAEELTALAGAIEALESGVAPNWKSNRRLTDMQLRKAPMAKALSFLQLRGASRQVRREKVLQLLNSAAQRLHSAVLTMASLRVQASQDHFIKVRQLIKDLIDRLNAEAASELNAKLACDSSVRLAVGQRDTAAADAETHHKDKALKNAEAVQLTNDISELSAQIAANNKALMEMTELRAEEQVDHAKVVSEAQDGLTAVQEAIRLLENFYSTTAVAPGPSPSPGGLLQKSQHGQAPGDVINGTRYDELRFKSTDSDREGQTVADVAPEMFDSTYHGQQEASKGIIGMLQVIEKDFDRTIETTNDAESKADGDFKLAKKANEDDTGLKTTDKATKSNTLTGVQNAIVDLESDLRAAREAHTLAKDTLENLRESCVEKEETYAERVAKREQEIEALKEAHAILEDWENQ